MKNKKSPKILHSDKIKINKKYSLFYSLCYNIPLQYYYCFIDVINNKKSYKKRILVYQSKDYDKINEILNDFVDEYVKIQDKTIKLLKVKNSLIKEGLLPIDINENPINDEQIYKFIQFTNDEEFDIIIEDIKGNKYQTSLENFSIIKPKIDTIFKNPEKNLIN